MLRRIFKSAQEHFFRLSFLDKQFSAAYALSYMRSEFVQVFLLMLTSLFTNMSRCFGEDSITLARTLALISTKHRLDHNFINFKSEELKLERALNDCET